MEARRSSLSTLEVIFLASVAAEVVIGRLVTRGLEKTPIFIHGAPQRLVPPTWFVALDYLALFLLYFAALVGVIVLAMSVVDQLRAWKRARWGDRLDRAVAALSRGALGGAAVFAAVVNPAPAQVVLHASLAAVAGHQVVRAWLRRTSVGTAVGMTLVALPILVYCAASLFSTQLWNDDQLAGGEAQERLGRWGSIGLVLAATLSPYFLAPRPFLQTITRLTPFACAFAVSGSLSLWFRARFGAALTAAERALGVSLRGAGPDQIALYVLALGTVAWTIAACLTAPSAARRRIGVGLALLVLTGWGFAWPLSFVAAGVGIVLMGAGALDVRREELVAYQPVTPAIDDETWQAYIGHVVTALRREHDGASAVSMRGEGNYTASIIVTERDAIPVKVRIDRVAQSVVMIDVVCGRDGDVNQPATWTLVARSPGVLSGGGHPELPSAGAVIKADDSPFDDRFRCRGDRAALLRLVNDAQRARLVAVLDGWLAYWDGRTVRHRVFPGQGAPLDQLIPLTALAVERRATEMMAERLVTVIGLCAEIAARGLSPEAGDGAAPVGARREPSEAERDR